MSGDRKLGAIWEGKFCELLCPGTIIMQHQKDRHGSAVYGEVQPCGTIVWSPSPDVTAWHGMGITTHHEIKHKNAHRGVLFGLEVYRIEYLQRFQSRVGQGVYYTIHDHDCSGGKYGTTNDIKHWVTQTIESLAKECDDEFSCATYRNGKKVKELMRFWHRSRFDQFEDVLDNIEMAAIRTLF
ncbi:MAG: hypothetical protein EBQ89_00560 [Alphaproteobacteria bacterium]|nr:hypothetical protein [Alphaproteobacteria bacterium]